MSLIDINWSPSDRQLRQFGCIALVALPALGWLWGAGSTLVGSLAAAGLVLAALGFVAPIALKPLFVGLSVVTMPIGMVVGEITMALVYYGVFVPIGLLLRLTGRDVLHKGLDRGGKTYWEPKKKPAGMASYYRQS